MDMVQWQYSCHQGHAASFASTLLYGPVMGQEDAWREACRVLREKHTAGQETVIMIGGDEDTIVPFRHVCEDLDRYLGKGLYHAETAPGGHGFPLKEGQRIVDILGRAWNL